MRKETVLLSIFVGMACVITAVTIYSSEELRSKKARANSFGIQPPYIKAVNLHPGEVYSQSIRVLRGDTSDRQQIFVRFDNLNIANWLAVEPKESLIMPVGQKYVNFNFKVNVPADAYSGEYKGKIYFAISSDSNKKSEVAISLGAAAELTVFVVGGRDGKTSLDIALAKKLADNKLANRLQGRFIMRAESYGQLYYLHPEKKIIYHLKSKEDFLKLLQEEGRGIGNILINKIAINTESMRGEDTDLDGLPDLWEESLGTNINLKDTDGDGFDDLEELGNGFSPLGKDKIMDIDLGISNSLSGFLLLQVEDKGQTWYVDPNNNKRILLADFDNILRVLEGLALGISEENYQKLVQ